MATPVEEVKHIQLLVRVGWIAWLAVLLSGAVAGAVAYRPSLDEVAPLTAAHFSQSSATLRDGLPRSVLGSLAGLGPSRTWDQGAQQGDAVATLVTGSDRGQSAKTLGYARAAAVPLPNSFWPLIAGLFATLTLVGFCSVRSANPAHRDLKRFHFMWNRQALPVAFGSIALGDVSDPTKSGNTVVVTGA